MGVTRLVFLYPLPFNFLSAFLLVCLFIEMIGRHQAPLSFLAVVMSVVRCTIVRITQVSSVEIRKGWFEHKMNAAPVFEGLTTTLYLS